MPNAPSRRRGKFAHSQRSRRHADRPRLDASFSNDTSPPFTSRTVRACSYRALRAAAAFARYVRLPPRRRPAVRRHARALRTGRRRRHCADPATPRDRRHRATAARRIRSEDRRGRGRAVATITVAGGGASFTPRLDRCRCAQVSWSVAPATPPAVLIIARVVLANGAQPCASRPSRHAVAERHPGDGRVAYEKSWCQAHRDGYDQIRRATFRSTLASTITSLTSARRRRRQPLSPPTSFGRGPSAAGSILRRGKDVVHARKMAVGEMTGRCAEVRLFAMRGIPTAAAQVRRR